MTGSVAAVQDIQNNLKLIIPFIRRSQICDKYDEVIRWCDNGDRLTAKSCIPVYDVSPGVGRKHKIGLDSVQEHTNRHTQTASVERTCL